MGALDVLFSLDPTNVTPLYPAPTSVNNVTTLFQYVGGFFPIGIFITVGLFFVSFIALKGQWETKLALPASFFITFLVSTLFYAIGLAPDWLIYIATIGTAVSTLLLFFTDY